METKTKLFAAAAGLGMLTVAAYPSLAASASDGLVRHAHGSSQGMMGGGMMGRGMMGGGMMGRGMMGGGTMGQGMMGRGMMGGGMMGRGMMGQGMTGQGMRVSPSLNVTVKDVRRFLEVRLERMGNKRLKVGEVKATDDRTITADIVTVDNSLVRRFKVDRYSGWMRGAN